MATPPKKPDVLAKLSNICLALPEAIREDMTPHASFRVAKKVFVYFLDNHHGDNIVGLSWKVLPEENLHLIAVDPLRFYMPAYVGPRGWVGLRLDLPKVDWKEVTELVRGSYAQIAPKRLQRIVLQP